MIDMALFDTPSPDVRVNAAEFAGNGGVDGFPIVLLAHGPAT